MSPLFDFGVLPPEINSARMYLGPGGAPLLAAAAAWGELAAQLTIAATEFGSVIGDLTGNYWQGPASVSMAVSAAPYVVWLHHTAITAEQTATQAKAAAAAYETAFTMTVPPPVVTANRGLLAALVATNLLGQNTPAIAATEAHYAQMWVQDAVAMYTYFVASAAASRLASFTEPRPVANSAGMPAQAAVAANPLSASVLFTTTFSATKIVNTVMSTTSSAVSGRGILIADERLEFGEVAARDDGILIGLLRSSGSTPAATKRSPMSATIGRAALIGRLSVPTRWADAAPTITPGASTTTPAVAAEVSAEPAASSGSVFSQSVLGTLSGNEPARRQHRSKPVIVRSPAAG